MGVIHVPSTKPAVEPIVIETIGVPELYASGAVIRQATGEAVEIILFVTRRINERIEHHEVARIHMPASGFEFSLSNAIAAWMNGSRH